MSRTLLFLIALIALVSCTHAGLLPVTKAGNAPWGPRMDHWLALTSKSFTYTTPDNVEFVLPVGSYIEFGGTPADGISNDVWVSTDMINWNMIGGRNPSTNSTKPDDSYIFHVGQAECQDVNNDFLYIIGGETPRQTLPVGYRSENGGATWIPFNLPTNRSYSNCVVDSQSQLYILNGILEYKDGNGDAQGRRPTNQVWVSNDNGRSFQQKKNATYSERMASSVAIQRNAGPNENVDIIYVVGGLSLWENGTEHGLCDVWVSTTRGESWIMVSDGKFPNHIDTTLVVSKKGLLLLVGGRNTLWSEGQGIYGSMDGGKSWGVLQPTPGSGYTGRIFPAAIIDNQGYLRIAGGNGGNMYNDIYITDDSLESNLPATAAKLELAEGIWNPARLCLGYLPCSAPLATQYIGQADFRPRFHHAAFMTRKDLTLNVRVGSSFPAKKFPSGSYIVAGGENQPGDNDVWISTDGAPGNWFLVGGRSTNNDSTKVDSQNPNASFNLYAGQVICGNYDGDILLAAGGDPRGGVTTSDSWTSRDAGATWKKNSAARTFSNRSWASCTFDSQNVLYLMNGVLDYHASSGDSRDLGNDIWVSRDFGATFDRIVEKAPFLPRGAAALVTAYYQGAAADTDLLYLIGGFTDVNQGRHGDALNDVWVSADKGINWVRTTANAAWVKRADHSAAVSRAGVIIVSGGRTDGADVHNNEYVFNDVWVSFDGGYNFYLVEESAFSPRRLHGLFVDNNGAIVVIGGEGGRNNNERFSNAVYKSTAASFNNPRAIFRILHRSDRDSITGFNPECAGYFVKQGQSCPAYLDPPAGLSTGAIAAIVILVIVVVLGICGWSFYSIRVHGELRIPCTNKSCNCCNNALKEDQLADDGFALHKGTGKLKSNLNGSLHHRLIDE